MLKVPYFTFSSLDKTAYIDNVKTMCARYIEVHDEKCLEKALFSASYTLLHTVISKHSAAAYSLGQLIDKAQYDNPVALRYFISSLIQLNMDKMSEQDFKKLQLFEDWVPVCTFLELPVTLLYATIAIYGCLHYDYPYVKYIWVNSGKVIESENNQTDTELFEKIREGIKYA